MQSCGIDLHFRAAWTAAKKIYSSTFSNHLKRPLPGGGRTHGFDDGIGSAPFVGNLSDQPDRILDFRHVKGSNRSQTFRHAHLALAFSDGNHAHAAAGKNADEFQPNGPASDYDH